MREIMFRGKRLDNGEWMEAGTIISTNDADPICWMPVRGEKFLTEEDAHGNILSVEPQTAIYRVDPASVGKYAGLTDTHGKRVFEGDLLRFFSEKTGCEGDGVGIINFGRFKDTDSISDFDQVGWYITISTLPGEATTICALEEEDILFEVIGNIHDTPELLEPGDGKAALKGVEGM